MSKTYALGKDTTKTLTLAYGIESVRADLVKFKQTAEGSQLQTTLQQALGEGPWNACLRLGYVSDAVQAVQEIPPQNYRFLNGENPAASDLFPDDVPHPNAVCMDVGLPTGVAQDGDPDKLIGIYECLKVADYDSNGNQISFGYSANPARVTMDIIKRVCPEMLEWGEIDWVYWCEWRDWCAALITVQVDGQSVQIPRFELNIFLQAPFNLAQILSRICQITCSEFQWNEEGQLRFLAPIDRAPVFTFDLSQVSQGDFKFIPGDTRERFNGVKIIYRNKLDTYLKEDEFVVKRGALITEDGGVENFLEINIGTAHPSQAERTAHFWAKNSCDMTDRISLVGAFESFVALPGDMGIVTHDVPNWTDKKVFIIQKEEDGDKGMGYPFGMQVRPVNPYSDTDQNPVITSDPLNGPDPFGAPPPATLTLTEQAQSQNDGTVKTFIVGKVVFGNFGFAQNAEVYHTPPGGSELRIDSLPSTSNKESSFRVSNVGNGIHLLRVAALSEFGVSQEPSLLSTKSINITVNQFYVDGKNINDAAARTFLSTDQFGRYTGRDLGIVPLNVIKAKIDSVSVSGEDVDVLLGISFDLLSGGTVHNQTDSVTAAQIDVFNQFGTLVKSFSPASIGRIGGQVICKFSRKYADPITGQSIFKIKILNYWSYSIPVYLQGVTLGTVMPPLKDPTKCPLDASGVPFSASAIRCFFQPPTNNSLSSKNVNLMRRKPGDSTFEYHAVNISSAEVPYLASGLAEYSEYEFLFEAVYSANSPGNIFRARTKQQGEAAPERPAPTGINGGANSGNPTGQLDFSCISAANVPTEVYVNSALADTKAAVGVGQTISHSIGGLSPNEWRSVKFRHKWGTNDYSEFTEEISRQTTAAPPAAQSPTFDYAVFDGTYLSSSWTPRGGGGNYTLEISDDGANPQAASGTGGWTTINNNIGANNYQQPFYRSSAQQTRYLRVSRNDVAGWAISAQIVIPALDNQGNQPPYLNSAELGFYNSFNARITGSYTPQGGTGDFTIYYDNLTTGSPGQYGQDRSAGQTTFSFLVPRGNETQLIEVYVMRTGINGESNRAQVEIPGYFVIGEA